ncbi:type II toxin-antitoxin system ParD family antitoxin [Rhizobium sp. RU36D]|uniref:type II toxin-antitoxin system ParD family antitoxin n=1 Tax=Rhizobium sp. RU36D TaxID=1907415 RepID=UPI0009D848A6|nr:type II toxin-antitoxin system ParD family antitoxin [Rhizobium sp. RU36D]SMC76792.1 antitoxin ParD1/3/4 [Rhizobium sp. RU36D]
MGKVTSVTIDEQLDMFIGEQVTQGRFKTADAVVEAGLRLLQKREAEIEAIRAAIIEGEESGEPVEFDFDKFLEEMNLRYVRAQ